MIQIGSVPETSSMLTKKKPSKSTKAEKMTIPLIIAAAALSVRRALDQARDDWGADSWDAENRDEEVLTLAADRKLMTALKVAPIQAVK